MPFSTHCTNHLQHSHDNEKVSLSFLNVKNLKSNHFYVEYLANISNITYLNELWLKKNEIDLIRKISRKEKNILFKSDMDENYSRGRPFGGQAWLIDNSFRILEHDFLSRHLCYIELEKKGIRFFIIGVYMPFDNPNSKADSLSMYQLTLTLILTLISKARNNKSLLFIIGDFNADIFRFNRFDNLLKEFTTNNNLIPLDYLNSQNIDHTFQFKTANNTYKSRIDHVFMSSESSESSQSGLLGLQCNIQDDAANMSDHNAVVLDITLVPAYHDETVSQKTIKENVNFNDENIHFFL